MGYPLYYTHFGGTAPARTGPNHATIVPYGRYETGDGKSIMLGLQNEREWAVFCEKVLLQPKLAQDPRYDSNSKRAAKRSEINALITEVFATLTTKQVIERLDASGIANARINTPDEVWEHPQLKARDRWRAMDSPVGLLATLLPAVTMPDFGARIDAVPALGEHTERILSELDYTSGDIVALRKAGVV
jgi:itaconate CoA-transferase